MIYACPRAVLSAGLAGETQHQLLRPIPRSPGIIPAVLTPDFSYRRAATVLSRNTTTIRHPGDDPPQFLAILARKLAGLAQSRRGRRAVPPAPPRRGRWWSRRSAPAAVPPAAVRRGQAPRREPRGGRRRATARFFRPMAACPGPTPRAFGQQTRRKAGAAPWMGQRSETKFVTVPPGGANDVGGGVAPFRPLRGGGGGGRPAPPERCAAARSAWRRAAPERPGYNPRERPALVVEDQIRVTVAGNRPSGPAKKALVELRRDAGSDVNRCAQMNFPMRRSAVGGSFSGGSLSAAAACSRLAPSRPSAAQTAARRPETTARQRQIPHGTLGLSVASRPAAGSGGLPRRPHGRRRPDLPVPRTPARSP